MGKPRHFFLAAATYAILGMLLGIHMAASQNHAQLVTHAHLLLIGWVTMFLYGAYLRLYPTAVGKLASVLWWIANVGTVMAVTGLYLVYGGNLAAGDPPAGLGAVLVLAGMANFALIVWRTHE